MITFYSNFKTAQQAYDSVVKSIESLKKTAKSSIDEIIAKAMTEAVKDRKFGVDFEIYGLDLNITLPLIEDYLHETVQELRKYGYLDSYISFNVDSDDADYETTKDWTCTMHIGWDLRSSTENKN